MGQFRNHVLTEDVRIVTPEGRMRWDTTSKPGQFFESLNGEFYDTHNQLFFEPAPDAPLPDIVCRAAGDTHVRTRFYRDDDGKIRHEVLAQSIGGAR